MNSIVRSDRAWIPLIWLEPRCRYVRLVRLARGEISLMSLWSRLSCVSLVRLAKGEISLILENSQGRIHLYAAVSDIVRLTLSYSDFSILNGKGYILIGVGIVVLKSLS